MDTHLTNIYDLDLRSMEEKILSWGEPKYRVKQVWQGLYQNLWLKPDEFSTLSHSLRSKLAENFNFSAVQAEQVLLSKDLQTEKTLFRLSDGHAVETVLMMYETRRTLCISTQVGCAMGCVFCATGHMGFKRHLSSGEIIAQVITYARKLKDREDKLTNIVVMGMGEPFNNYDSTLAAIDRLNDPDGFNFGARRFTISTVGIIPMIEKFTKEKRGVNLAISLHAATDELRNRILPVNRKYPIEPLLDACRAYVDQTGRRITFEWALIEGLNDTLESAQTLAKRLKGLLCHVNIISLNPTSHYGGLSTRSLQANAFKAELEKYGIPCSIRLRRGLDIHAGCGQLAEKAQ